MNSHNHVIESPIKKDSTTSERTDVILKNGIYCAENSNDWLNACDILPHFKWGLPSKERMVPASLSTASVPQGN